MGNLNCTRRAKAKKTKVLSELEKKASDGVGNLKDKLPSLPNGDGNETQAPTTNESIEFEPTNAPEIVSVWICQNRMITQRTQIDLGASPTLNVLIEQIQYNFPEYNDENTLEVLRDDNTWAEIAVDNVNIPLDDVGIKHNGLVSFKTKDKQPETAPPENATTD